MTLGMNIVCAALGDKKVADFVNANLDSIVWQP